MRIERQLSGTNRVAAHLIWGFVAVLILVLFAIGVPPEYRTHVQFATEGFIPELTKLGLSVQFYAVYRTALNLIEAVSFVAIGVAIFLRKPNDLMVVLVSLANMSFGMLFVPTLLQIIQTHPSLTLPVGFVRATGLGLSLIVLYYLFPDGRFVPHWSRFLAIGWAIISLAWMIEPRVPANLVYLNSWQQNMTLSYSLFLFSYSTGIAAQLYRFKNVSNPIERQQTKFVVFGTTAAFMGFLLYHIPLVFIPAFDAPTMPRLLHIFIGIPIYHVLLIMAPLAIALSVFRYRLWDVDRVINRSLVSGSLSIMLGLIYFGSVIITSRLSSALTGNRNTELVTAISTLAVAALFNPLRRIVQGAIDRRFFTRKYDAIRTLDSFGSVVRNEVNLDALTRQLLIVVNETMHPMHAEVWLNPQTGSRPGGRGELSVPHLSTSEKLEG